MLVETDLGCQIWNQAIDEKASKMLTYEAKSMTRCLPVGVITCFSVKGRCPSPCSTTLTFL